MPSIPAYNQTFEDFNAPLMQRFRELAYGEDIGQHSWTSANELRGFCTSIKQNDDVKMTTSLTLDAELVDRSHSSLRTQDVEVLAVISASLPFWLLA